MSLATRCGKCGTIFRVVQDQLKVSGGWVRCGRCQEIFNALEGLFDLEREPPPERPRSALTATQIAAQEMAEFVASHGPATPSADVEQFPSTHEDDALESRFLHRLDDAADPDDGDPDFEDARFPSELPLDAAEESPAAADAAAGSDTAEATEPEPPAAPKKKGWRERRAEQRAAALSSMLTSQQGDEPALPSPPPVLPPGAPGFLRQAEAEARWRRPRVRASLVVAGLLLLGMLAVQAAVQFRDAIAVRWSEARPALATLCQILSCQIEPLRQLGALTVEASGLSPVDGSDAYRLSLTLLNRGTLPLALPSVDLRITDAAGSLIARRALAPADFRTLPGGASPAATIAAHSEQQWQLLFLAGRGSTTRVSGYTIELFYP